MEPLILCVEARRHERRDLVHHIGQIEEPRVGVHLAGLEARHVEQVIHQIDEAVRAEKDHVDELALALAPAPPSGPAAPRSPLST